MILQQRVAVLTKLGNYLLSEDPGWEQAKQTASYENGWFIPPFIDRAVRNIAENFLPQEIIEKWTSDYQVRPGDNGKQKRVGIVMAGNIPLVGFHDLLCVFIAGHIAIIKPSSKDSTLIKHLVTKMSEWDKQVNDLIQFGEQLKSCDAYIATGSNNSAGYFEYYFKKYPHIIRRNRTSVAILTGNENKEELENLADDVYLYFGLGCRNVTKIFVPQDYDFIPLLGAFKKYDFLFDHHKYKNNYDYNLAILLLNKKKYMSNSSLLLVEDSSPFSPISVLNYEFYGDRTKILASLKENIDIQCIAGKDQAPFGKTQNPSIRDYADGIDTLAFLVNL